MASSAEKIAKLRDGDAEISASEMARKLGISRERVRQILVVLGLPTKTVNSTKRCVPLSLRKTYYRREYICWWNMIDRCVNPKNANYRQYGARGISVCDKWMQDFHAFYKDMGPRPSSKHSIDRINNDGNYEPSNCRWATFDQQIANRRQQPKKPKAPKIYARAGRPKKKYPDAVMRVIERKWPPRKGQTWKQAHAEIKELVAPHKVTRAWLYANVR